MPSHVPDTAAVIVRPFAAASTTLAVEDVQPGTTALLRSMKARQAADRLVLGAGYIETGLVLVDPLGEPVKPYTYSDRFESLCRQAGVRVIRLHSIRDTVALIGHRAGVAPADVAALLGHTVAVHLARYVPLTERGARTAAAGLGAAISGLR
jgi:integrase